jgi:hypothetical protein
LEKVDMGDGFVPRLMFVNQNLEAGYKAKLIELLKEYVDCFARSYTEMHAWTKPRARQASTANETCVQASQTTPVSLQLYNIQPD